MNYHSRPDRFFFHYSIYLLFRDAIVHPETCQRAIFDVIAVLRDASLISFEIFEAFYSLLSHAHLQRPTITGHLPRKILKKYFIFEFKYPCVNICSIKFT